MEINFGLQNNVRNVIFSTVYFFQLAHLNIWMHLRETRSDRLWIRSHRNQLSRRGLPITLITSYAVNGHLFAS